jgi:hypothetical protein
MTRPKPRTPAQVAADQFRTGRPAIDAARRHTHRVSCRLTDATYDRLKQHLGEGRTMADLLNCILSDWLATDE